MRNKGRRHKSGNGPYASGNCKGMICGITRSITSMAPPNRKKIKIGNLIFDPKTSGHDSSRFVKKKWHKRVRGYFKSQTKDLLNQEYD